MFVILLFLPIYVLSSIYTRLLRRLFTISYCLFCLRYDLRVSNYPSLLSTLYSFAISGVTFWFKIQRPVLLSFYDVFLTPFFSVYVILSIFCTRIYLFASSRLHLWEKLLNLHWHIRDMMLHYNVTLFSCFLPKFPCLLIICPAIWEVITKRQAHIVCFFYQ